VDWMHLAQDRDQWRALLHVVSWLVGLLHVVSQLVGWLVGWYSVS
jgi:hypothetical protein